MRSFSRPQIVNGAYYGGGALLIAVALLFLMRGWLTASIVASVAAALWLVGGYALMFLFEPALHRWLNAEPAEPPACEGETVRLN